VQTLIESAHRMPHATPLQREAVHDLRNLFGIVASAKWLLERDPVRPQRQAILDALADAARRGDRLTTHLLAPGTAVPRLTDLGARLADLVPMMQALAGARITLDVDLALPRAHVRMAGDQFDAAIMELVANAVAAGARTIAVRNRLVGSRIWVLVSDDGPGMSASTLVWARSGTDAGKAHGGGFARVHRFARMTHGHVRLRSRRGAGTSIALVLPVVLSIAGIKPGAPSERAFPQAQGEDR